jgi:hypothetical protein
MAIRYLFCDEGGKYQKGALVSFAGVAASASRLESFNNEWNALLTSYELESVHMRLLADIYSVHGPMMPRDQTIDERMAVLMPFADCINKYLEIGLVQTWDVTAYAGLPTEAKARLGGSQDPHYLAFIRGILEMEELLDEEDRVSIICDDDVVKSWNCYLHYRAVCSALPELNKRFAALSFARDENFPALQAADMVAFLSRLQANGQFHGEKNEWFDLYNHLTAGPKPVASIMRWLILFAGERELTALANDLQKPLDAC